MIAFIKGKLQHFYQKLRAVKYMLILRTIFGFYYKINAKKSSQFLVKIYCVMYSAVNIFVVCISSISLKVGLWNSVLFISTSVEMMVLSISAIVIEEFYFLSFCNKIQTIHRFLSLPQVPLEASSLYVLYLQIVLKIFHTLCYMWLEILNFKIVIALCFGSLLISTNLLFDATTIVIFDLFHSTMKHIRKSLERKLSTLNLPNRVKSMFIQKHVIVYKHLLDNMQENSKTIRIKVRNNYLINNV